MSLEDVPRHFPSHPRFAYRAVLGRGGMGVVYRAFDREIEQEVALKTIDDPEQARTLKREFRVVADLSHPNLVAIYELFVEQGQCFFTMELLAGGDFIQFVRGGADGEGSAATLGEAGVARAIGGLGQLADGVAAIHAAGMLHRDIKPSNVVVCPRDGDEPERVVLLDFGLVAPVTARADPASVRNHLAGTPARMPPEQLWGEALGPASDWYAVGVLLYQALTGREPDLRDRLFLRGEGRKVERPRLRVDAAPEWLDALVGALLDPDPTARPGAREIRQSLTRARAVARQRDERLDPAQRRVDGTFGPQLASIGREVFVGRRNELAALRDAFERAREGEAVAVLVSGVSGIGKTELLRRFTQRVRASNDLVVLRGRCHPRESIPFAGLDQAIDDLVGHLASLERGGEALVPEHAPQLLRLFPAFRAVPAFAHVRPDEGSTEPSILRHLAAGALRELLLRLAVQRPIVVWIDDLQWADEDSSFLLRSILRPPAPSRLLLLLSYRSEEESDSEVLRGMIRFVSGGQDVRVVTIEAGPLEPDESSELVSEMLERLGTAPAEVERDIARESEGSPFFIGELVRHHAQVGTAGGPGGGPVHIDDVVGRRFDALSFMERCVLETIAVAGAPIAQEVALRAVEYGAAGRPVVGALEKRCLLTSSMAGGVRRVRPYHDRIGESVLERLSPERRLTCHRALASALEREPEADPEALVTHWLAAGETRRAGAHAVAAAGRAANALAFGRASDLYAVAIAHAPPTEPRHPLRVALAEVLASSGRGARAGTCFEEAARELARAGGNELEVIALRRRAAEQFLCCGLIDEGLAIMREVAPRLGLSMPRTPAAAVRSFLWQRFRIALRGLEFTPRAAEGIAAETLERMDAVFGTAKGVSMVVPTVAAALHAQHLRLALDLGEPSRVSQALTNEAAWYAIIGGKRYWRRAADVLRRTAELTAGSTRPYDDAFFRMGAGAVAWSRGDWQGAITQSTMAMDLYRRRCRGVAFEIAITNVFFLSALALAGRIGELTDRTLADLQDARERGDLFSLSACIMPEPVLTWLAADQADVALAQADETIQRWPAHMTLTQHYHHVIATGEALLYAGRPWEAWERIVAAWPQLQRARYLSLSCPRHLLLYLRASVAVAAASATDAARDGHWTRDRLERTAARDARRIARGGLPFSRPCAQTIGAALAFRKGDAGAAARLLQSAVAGFDLAGMPVHREAARLRLGTVLGAGEEYAGAAHEWLRAAGVKRPDAVAAVFAPGFAATR
jgi:tRNA A-37 threonylcarbamoyl transferase component Bud32